MKILMLKTGEGCPDGAGVTRYHKGETYDVPDFLAEVFFGNQWAQPVKQPLRPDTDGGVATMNDE